MDASQIENAIDIAWNPTSPQTLKAQALAFLQQLRSDPNAWRICLPLFVQSPPPADTTRHLCLEVLNKEIEYPSSGIVYRVHIKECLWTYVQQNYGGSRQTVVDTAHIQNKLTQTLTYLFTTCYKFEWKSFFDDFLALAGSGQLGQENIPATILYLRILTAVHDEIGDVILVRSDAEARRNAELKDLIRDRDAQKVSLSWQEILAKWRQIDLTIVEMCLRSISRWVSWIDISLVVNQTVLQALLEMAGQQNLRDHAGAEVKVRDAAIDAFTEVASKKMRPPAKMELLLFLNLDTVVGQLIASPPLAELRTTPDYDTDLAETVAKLVNSVVRDLVMIVDPVNSVTGQTVQHADELLRAFIPHLLRFFSDEYDEVCSSVIESLTDVLHLFRKIVKKGPLSAKYTTMLPPILDAIISKMKYDETTSWGEEDEQTDEAEFLDLRRRLNTLQQYVAAIDEQLYMDTLTRLVAKTFSQLGPDMQKIDWRDLDLALHGMYLFGDLATRNRGIQQKREPSSAASERLTQMMTKMMQSTIETYPHPAIQLQYMELCVRYGSFFEQNQQFIPKALEVFVRFAHDTREKVRLKSWYLFLRFVRLVRGQLGDVAQNIIQAIADLLPIQASLPSDRNEDGDDDDSIHTDYVRDPTFDSQLNIFEAVGCISSTASIPLQNRILFAQSIMNPIFADMELYLVPAKNGDDRSLLQMHHDIKALGTLARGYTDWMPGVKTTPPPPNEIAEEFVRAAEAILVALDNLSSSIMIREACRYSFARLVGGCGVGIFPQLPRWIDGIMSQSSTKEEMSFFLRLLEQVIFAFKTEIFSVLDLVLTPLFRRVFERLAEIPTGTDDEILLGDLRREYLSFILVILNQNLGGVFVSSNNQGLFDTLISTIEHFASSPSDLQTSRLAVSALTKMTTAWGGPDIPLPLTYTPGSTPSSPSIVSPAPVFPGFDTFAITRFSPLSWAIPSSPGFKVSDPGSRGLIQDIAALQQEILKKTGVAYLEVLARDLAGKGLTERDVEIYIGKLRGDPKAFKEFLVAFLGRGE